MDLQGEHSVVLDDKGRMLLPAKIRKQISSDKLTLTKGIEKCLWLFLPEEWERTKEKIAGKESIFDVDFQAVRRRIIAPAEDVVIDRSGRVKLSLSLMKAMKISKICRLIGMGTRLEIWDEAIYFDYDASNADEVKKAWKGFGDV